MGLIDDVYGCVGYVYNVASFFSISILIRMARKCDDFNDAGMMASLCFFVGYLLYLLYVICITHGCTPCWRNA